VAKTKQNDEQNQCHFLCISADVLPSSLLTSPLVCCLCYCHMLHKNIITDITEKSGLFLQGSAARRFIHNCIVVCDYNSEGITDEDTTE